MQSLVNCVTFLGAKVETLFVTFSMLNMQSKGEKVLKWKFEGLSPLSDIFQVAQFTSDPYKILHFYDEGRTLKLFSKFFLLISLAFQSQAFLFSVVSCFHLYFIAL